MKRTKTTVAKEASNSPNNLRAFFVSVRAGDHEKVKSLLKEQLVNVNTMDPDDPQGATAIIIASELEDVEMVRILMKAKPKPADVNAETHTGRRAIWWAAKHGNNKLAEQLLKDSKCEVNYIDRQTGCSPLYRAIVSNKADVVRLILHAGGDVNMRRLGYDKEAETPLMKAVQMNNLEVCQMLINSLCDKHAKTEDGLTALHFAIAYRRYDICRMLVHEGMKLHARSHSGVTPMTLAIEHHNPAMVKILIEYGYKIDRPYKWGELPIQQAIALHSQECAMTLAHWGCSLSEIPASKSGKKKKRPFSAFFLAINERLMSLARQLIDLRPGFLREEWLWEKEWPVALYRRPMVRDWLLEQASTPRTLKCLCRAAVYQRLGLYAPTKLEKLPLPEPLRLYMTFPEHIKEIFYEEKPLEEECPYDCAVRCPRKAACPEIDLSFSDDSDQDIEYW